MAIVPRRTTPVEACWADEIVGEGIAGHDSAAHPRRALLQRHAFDDVVRVPSEIGDTGIFIYAQVIHR
jgi:hypothetical protein